MPPLISIILPVYNAAPYLHDALDSLRAQTFTDFEIIAIDDGSTDDSLAILNTIAAIEPRLHITTQPNAGVSITLNRALDRATGRYIARMDADDISLPHRLATQLDFLNAHPAIALVGSWDQRLNHTPPLIRQFPTDPDHLAAAMLFRNPISHPTVMWDRERTGDIRYDSRWNYIEDYALWATLTKDECGTRNAECGKNASSSFRIPHSAFRIRISNVPEPLLLHRIPGNSICARFHTPQVQQMQQLQWQLAREVCPAATDADQKLHAALAFDQLTDDAAILRDAHDWLIKLRRANTITRRYPDPALRTVLTGRFVALIRHAHNAAPHVLETFAHSPLAPNVTAPDARAALAAKAFSETRT
jgi:glycosyltransferase involved in cell wall biosynthesis